MDIKDLLAGIAVVIDDALSVEIKNQEASAEGPDRIGEIVGWFEREWDLAFVKSTTMPEKPVWSKVLDSASFVLLDWKLWATGAGQTEKERCIAESIEFLRSARDRLVPVFIFTNEDPEDVVHQLPEDVYDGRGGRSFLYVNRKLDLWSEGSFDTKGLEAWVRENASIYALKVWNRVVGSAKNELFAAMCERSMDWPRVFWKTYKEDRAEPSASLTNLISDSLQGRMRMDAFEEEYLGGEEANVSSEELRGLIGETSFRRADVLPGDEVRSGDLFKAEKAGRYWLNLRPDCDCIPRGGSDVGEVEMHCVRGKRLRPRELEGLFSNGHFEERVSQSVVFAVLQEGRSILFDFTQFRVWDYSELRNQRIGRLLHPYVTRVQQRYGLFVQRQALPRIPDSAVSPQKLEGQGKDHGLEGRPEPSVQQSAPAVSGGSLGLLQKLMNVLRRSRSRRSQHDTD